MRLNLPIPLLHETAEDATVGGYFVPKGLRVMINVCVIERDKDSWEDPEEFRPSRFLDSTVPNFKESHFEFIQFESGRRSCHEMQLGLYAFDLALAHLLNCLTWELPNVMKKLVRWIQVMFLDSLLREHVD